MKDGSKKRFTENLIKGDIVGIVLNSKKVLSVNIYHTKFSNFSLTNYPKELNKYTKYSFSSSLTILESINENEYVPSITELKEIMTYQSKINFIWKKIKLKEFPRIIWFWSSTIKDENTIWVIRGRGRGEINCLRYDTYGNIFGYVLCLLKNK